MLDQVNFRSLLRGSKIYKTITTEGRDDTRETNHPNMIYSCHVHTLLPALCISLSASGSNPSFYPSSANMSVLVTALCSEDDVKSNAVSM